MWYTKHAALYGNLVTTHKTTTVTNYHINSRHTHTHTHTHTQARTYTHTHTLTHTRCFTSIAHAQLGIIYSRTRYSQTYAYTHYPKSMHVRTCSTSLKLSALFVKSPKEQQQQNQNPRLEPSMHLLQLTVVVHKLRVDPVAMVRQ